MNRLRFTSAVAVIVLAMLPSPRASAQMPILPATPPSGPTTATLTPDQKTALIAKLEKAKARDKNRRANHSQNPLKQSDYDEKIDQINRIVKGLQSGSDYSMADVDRALRYPKSDPYH
jgi:hypothetical protein